MGPEERRGPAKLKNQRRSEMSEAIENAVSQALTGYNPTNKKRSFFERAKESLQNAADEEERRAIEGYKCGGTVKHGYSVGGDVRYNNKGKTY